MQKYICTPCGYVYDPEEGDAMSGVDPGTAFEDLPEHAAMWVANYTTAQVYLNDLGGDSNYANYAQEAERYKSMVLREHLRNQRFSTSKTRFARRIRRARFMV